MHEHALLANIIGVEILDLEVIDSNRYFENLMLDSFDCDIFAVDKLKNISGTELNSRSPAFFGSIELVPGSRNDLLSVYSQMNKFVCLIDKDVQNLFFCDESRGYQ